MINFGQMGQQGQRGQFVDFTNRTMVPAEQTYADLLRRSGMRTGPVSAPGYGGALEGLGRIAQAIMGRRAQELIDRKAGARQKAMDESIRQNMQEQVGEDMTDTLQLGQQFSSKGDESARGPGSMVIMRNEDIPSNAKVEGYEGEVLSAYNKDHPLGLSALNMPDTDERIGRPIMDVSPVGQSMLAMNQNTYGGMDPSLMLQYQIGQQQQNQAFDRQKQMKQMLFTPEQMAQQTQLLQAGIRPIDPRTPLQKDYDRAVREQGYEGTLVDFDLMRRKASQPQWTMQTQPGQRPMMVSDTGEMKPVPQSTVSKKVDQSFGKFYSEFYIEGGRADYLKGMSQVQSIVDDLQNIVSGKDTDTVLSGKWTGLTPDWAQSFVNPDALDAKETIAEVTQRNLKAVLGGQFGEKEGQMLIDRAFNPSLPEAENLARVTRLLTSMRIALADKDAAAEYYRQHGTMEGYVGKEWTKQDFFDAIDGRMDVRTHKQQRRRGDKANLPAPPPGFKVIE